MRVGHYISEFGKGLDPLRRVPANPSYALIGSGRLARHLSFYLSQTQKLFFKWSRDLDPDFNTFFDPDNHERLQKAVCGKTFVLLAVSDEALPGLIQDISEFKNENQTLIHFSAAHTFVGAFGLHPLMTFGQQRMAVDRYAEIPFCEPAEHVGLFQEVFPGWKNPVFALTEEQRRFYHACLVASGNFTSLLWQMIESRFENELNLNPELLKPYRDQVFENIRKDAKTSLTGPLARGDQQTITSNLNALAEDPLKDIYQSFAGAFTRMKEDQ